MSIDNLMFGVIGITEDSYSEFIILFFNKFFL